MIIPSARRGFPIAIGIAAAIGGAMIALHYQRLGLALSHYDARGHLVVARRIIDSITPGWQQIGAVWLPLPHLLNALPVQVDAFYRSGASGIAISIAAFGVAAAAVAWLVLALTGSAPGAFAAAAVFALNPNVLYLQATPMTEPLLLALTTVSIAWLVEWCGASMKVDGSGGESCATTAWVGCSFALACMTRYEAWPVTAAAFAAAVWTLWRRGHTLDDAVRRVASIALYPVLAILGFVVVSRVVIGEWFVASGFFVPENKALGLPVLAAAEVWWGAHALSGSLVTVVGTMGVAMLLLVGLYTRHRADALIVLSLGATAALPWSAFVKGHPFRVRYMVPLLAIEAIGAGFLVGLTRRAQVVAALAVVAIAGYELNPLDAKAPMVIEAQWDRPNSPVRQRVTDCLAHARDGEKIMASMGSLGHYMQETARAGFALRDYLHEGNGDIWLAALEGPRPFAGWMMVEEKAEGGDMLATLAREHPHFLDGYSRVCEGAGVVLYKRADR